MTDYLGDFRKGSEVAFVLQAVNTDGEPAWPVSAPVLSIFNEDTLVYRMHMAADPQVGVAGAFRLPVFLDDHFPDSGWLTGMMTWNVGGSPYATAFVLRILAGGDDSGSAIACKFVRRPSTGYIVWQSDGGFVFKGTNPKG